MSAYCPAGVCVRLFANGIGKHIVLPCTVLDEDRVVGSDGTFPTDRVHVAIAETENAWVLRSDLCHEDGELIAWRPYEEETQ